MSLLLLIRLQYIQELLVRIRIVGKPCFDLVQIMDSMVEFGVGLLLRGVLVVQVAQQRSSRLGILESGGVRSLEMWRTVCELIRRRCVRRM